MVRVSLSLPLESFDSFTDALIEAEAIAVDIDPASNTVGALFMAKTNIAEALAEAGRQSGLAACPDYSLAEVADQDWVRLTQAQFQPIQVTPRLHIVPTWSSPPDPDAINLRLDPSLAFGTGSHPTTRLCLRWLASMIRGDETVVDYGCGSGILAIAALKLGARHAIGVDIDDGALDVARENARRNGVDAVFCLPQELANIQAGIVVANILLQPLLELAPEIAAIARCRIALSGIMADEVAELARSYEEWFVIDARESDEAWALVTGARR
ncbi:MAG: 50S ribosomal protein L11 methyltransferase [Burkholderiales bacterium]